jgi:hypothetical protein
VVYQVCACQAGIPLLLLLQLKGAIIKVVIEPACLQGAQSESVGVRPGNCPHPDYVVCGIPDRASSSNIQAWTYVLVKHDQHVMMYHYKSPAERAASRNG